MYNHVYGVVGRDRYVFSTIRPLLETDLQGLIMTPFDAREFREKLDQMELPRKISRGAVSCQ
jgi:hypothetical protein